MGNGIPGGIAGSGSSGVGTIALGSGCPAAFGMRGDSPAPAARAAATAAAIAAPETATPTNWRGPAVARCAAVGPAGVPSVSVPIVVVR
jgi:hypothetical protein